MRIDKGADFSSTAGFHQNVERMRFRVYHGRPGRRHGAERGGGVVITVGRKEKGGRMKGRREGRKETKEGNKGCNEERKK